MKDCMNHAESNGDVGLIISVNLTKEEFRGSNIPHGYLEAGSLKTTEKCIQFHLAFWLPVTCNSGGCFFWGVPV